MAGKSSPEAATTRLRSFGRRRTKRLQGARAERLEALTALEIPAQGAVEVEALFSSSVSALWLEIGFGGGEHLAALAVRHPEVGFIGCEPFMDGVSKLIAEIQEHDLRNIRIHPDDARSLLERMPEASLDRVYFLFPDPWPKLRHHKRRLVNPDMLDLLARVLKPGGLLTLATDHAGYAEWMLLHLLADARFGWTASSPEDFRNPPEGWVETRYQAKAAEEGRAPVFLLFQRG